MKIIYLSLTLLLCLFVVVVGAADLNGSCEIRFQGTSTLHGFTGVGSCEPFGFSEIPSPGADRLFSAGRVEVAVAKMDTDNDSRDRKMYKMFEADQFPFISGRFSQMNPHQLIRQIQSGKQLSFELTMHGKTKTVNATVKEIVLDAERLTFAAEFPVSLASFDLKPPGVLGIIRVADEVLVTVDVTLQGNGLMQP